MTGRALLFVLATLAACGGGGPEPPACTDGEARALGGSSGYLEVNRGDSSGELYLEWDELVANGDSVSARGHVIATTGYGNCVSGPLDSEIAMDDDGEGGTFQLRHLRVGPPFCGEEISGEIAGCFRSPP